MSSDDDELWQGVGVLMAAQRGTVTETLELIQARAALLGVDPVDVAVFVQWHGCLPV